MTESQKWFYLIFLLISAGLIWLLSPILTPFVISAVLAYLGDPLADWLEARGFSRTLAVVTVFSVMTLLLLAVLLLLIPVLEHQISTLIERMPAILGWLQTQLDQLLGLFGMNSEEEGLKLTALVDLLRQHWQQAGGLARGLLQYFGRSGQFMVELALNLTLIPVVTFYLLRDWDILVARIHELLPRHIEPTIRRLMAESDAVLGAFMRGQLSVMVLLGLFYTAGLWLLGVEFAFLIGMGAGLISFIPYLGTIVGIAAACIAAWFQFHSLQQVLLVAGVFGIGQLLQDMVLIPRLVGQSIGLHPVAVIFAVMAGGQLFGFVGILIALPAASVVVIVLRHMHQAYQQSTLYRDDDSADAAS